MINWILDNLSTIIISIILILVVALIIYNLVQDRKKGKTSCGSNCAHCALSNSCHKIKKT